MQIASSRASREATCQAAAVPRTKTFLWNCSERLVAQDRQHTTGQIRPKRRVHLLKPLQDDLQMQSECALKPLRISRAESDTTDGSSVLSFSPTSVLPQRAAQHEVGRGILFKALQKHDRFIQEGPASNAHNKTDPVSSKLIGSWASRQTAHDLSGHQMTVSALPGASSPDPAAPIVIPPQARPLQPRERKVTRSTLETAWRWKFKRQWGKEQLRGHLPECHYDDDESSNDPWHDAFHMIQAANTTPAAGVPISDHDCYAEASPSPLLDDDDLDGLLEMDSPLTDVTPVARDMVRTTSSQALAEAAAKARELRQYQVKVQQQNEQVFSSSWGQPLLPAARRNQPF
ncbi:TPA: hypothetical protein ACH3X2_008211 [Trebouxia sp. C0005]|nr:MAG: hypothetical protein FRX49_01397 [Trebouxia sp. A1-2]